MEHRRRLPSAFVLLAALSAVACASTKLTSVYVADSVPNAPYRKLLVVGLGASEGGRAAFENAVADRLAAHRVTSVASGNLIGSMEDVNRDAVRGWVAADGYDGVLVTRLVDVKKETTYRPATYTDLWGYWGYYGSYVSSPGYVLETTTLLVETTLFDAETARVVYSAQSETFQPSSRDEMIRELVSLLVGDLTERGLLPPGS